MKKTQKSNREKIWQQLKHGFQWQKVHAAMNATQWTWGKNGVPTVQQLQRVARELFDDLYVSAEATGMGKGGFLVERYLDESGRLHYRLSFILERTET